MEEPKIHRGAREHAVRARVVERENGLRPVLGDDGGEAVVDGVERGVPGDGLEAPLALRAHAAQR